MQYIINNKAGLLPSRYQDSVLQLHLQLCPEKMQKKNKENAPNPKLKISYVAWWHNGMNCLQRLHVEPEVCVKVWWYSNGFKLDSLSLSHIWFLSCLCIFQPLQECETQRPVALSGQCLSAINISVMLCMCGEWEGGGGGSRCQRGRLEGLKRKTCWHRWGEGESS